MRLRSIAGMGMVSALALFPGQAAAAIAETQIMTTANQDPAATPAATDGDQTAAAEPGTDRSLDEIVVTARRREERLLDVPLSVTVASQQTLENLAITNTESLNRLDPALTIGFPVNSRLNGFVPFIRAQGATSNSGSGARASVVSYFAEIPYFRTSFFDLANIQVLKGPQGTLFGETSTGGVVLFTPQRPTNRFEGYATGEIGNYNYYQLEAAVNVPIIDDVWNIRIAGQLRRRDGYTTLRFSQPSASPVDADDIDTSDLRLSSLLTPFDGFEIYTIFVLSRASSNGTGVIRTGVFDRLASMRTIPSANAATAARYAYFSGQSPPAGLTWFQIAQQGLALQQAEGVRTSFANNDQNALSNFMGLANTITWEVAPQLTFKSITGLHRTETGPNSGLNPDADFAPIADNFGAICAVGLSPADCKVNGPLNFTQELQLQSSLFDDRLTIQAGGYYRSLSDVPWAGPAQFSVLANSSAVPAASCTAFGLPGTPCLTLTRSASRSKAIYGQVTFTVLPRLDLTAGIRNTWDDTRTESTAGPLLIQNFQGNVINLSPFAPNPLPGASVSVFDSPQSSAISYTLAANWRITDDISIYATHRRGYKGGGVNRLVPVDDPTYVYGPETITDYEAGIRGRLNLEGATFDFSLSGFTGKFADIQRATFGVVNGSYVGLTQNVANATIRGLEASLNARFARWFEIGGFLAYTDAQFDDWIEVSTCARQQFRTGCAGSTSAAIPIIIDHVGGTATVNGIVDRFQPDLFAEAPKIRWSIRPVLRLGFLGSALDSARLSANILYTSKNASLDNNYSAALPEQYVVSPSRTTVDLRFDWDRLPWIDADLGFYAGITNLTNLTARISSSDLTATCDCTYAQYTEPRMFYAGFRYQF